MHDDVHPRHDEERQWRGLHDDGPILHGLPMSPAMRACLRDEAAALDKYSVLALPIVAGLLGAWFFWDSGSRSLVLTGAIALIAAAGYGFWKAQRVRQDLAAGTFNRFAGSWSMVQTRRGWTIRLPDGSRFPISDTPTTFFTPPDAGEIDVAPRSRIAFEIRNADGHVLRRHPGYRA